MLVTDQRLTTEQRDLQDLAELVAYLDKAPPLFLSVIGMRSTHAAVFVRLHENECPFLGVGVGLGHVSYFEGKLLRCGPHRFHIVETTVKDRKNWCLQSEGEEIKIVARTMRLTDIAGDES